MRLQRKWLSIAQDLLPVAFLLLTAAAYGSALWSVKPWFGFTREWLTIMMQIEFLVIHSFAFIMVIAFLKPQALGWRILRWTLFGAFSALYLFAAWESEGGWASAGTFLGLTAVTYLGAMLRRISVVEMILLGIRWFFNSFVFLFLSDKLDLPTTVNDWTGLPRVLEFGLWYFIALAVVETAIAWGRWFFMREQKAGDAMDQNSVLENIRE